MELLSLFFPSPCPIPKTLIKPFFLSKPSFQSYPSYSWRPRVTAFATTESSIGISSQINGEEEEEGEEERFVEVGYVSKVHGLRGELRVKPNTDFPELRFAQPGRRWLKTRYSGKEVISEVELLEGRSHPGQKSWIITLEGIDDVDKAKQIVGSTFLVREDDRPELEEGEIYTLDLVGMRVLLKETGKLVGKVVNVFNFGAGDLLQVLLESSKEELDHGDASKPDAAASGQVIWIPFVEAIVPEVDMDTREMHITPPKGLLELNLRSDSRSKKERRQLEWKERKKLQHKIKAAKKKLSEMGQSHILEGLKVGEKAQKGLLARQLANISFNLFQHALQCISSPFNRFNLSEFIAANSAILAKNSFRTAVPSLVTREGDDPSYVYWKEGLQLLRESKAAIVVVVNDESGMMPHSAHDDLHTRSTESVEPILNRLEQLLANSRRILEVENQGIPVPLIVVSSVLGIESYEQLLLDNKYFGFDSQKVWLVEEEKLPIVSNSSESNKVLLKSSWEILQAPTGSGGVFNLLSSNKILDKLIELGIEYIQVCSLGGHSKSLVIGNPLLFGYVDSRKADMGINMLNDKNETSDDDFDIIFSMRHLKYMCNEISKHQFYAIPEKHAHMEEVNEGGEWVKQVYPIPDTPNSYRFYSSIYSALNKCDLDTICLMYVSDQ